MNSNLAYFLIGTFCAVPLSIIGNMLTPLATRWYSATTLQRAKRRRLKLCHKLWLSEKEWTFTSGEWELYKAGFWRLVFQAQVFIVLITFFSAFTDLAFRIYEASHGVNLVGELPWAIRVPTSTVTGVLEALQLTYFSEGLAFLLVLAGLVTLNRYSDYHTETGREQMRQEIERLKSKYGPALEEPATQKPEEPLRH